MVKGFDEPGPVLPIAVILSVLLRAGVATAARSGLCCHAASDVSHPLKMCFLKLTEVHNNNAESTSLKNSYRFLHENYNLILCCTSDEYLLFY